MFGGDALSPETTPLHTHAFSGSVHLPSHGITAAEASGDDYAKAGDTGYSGTTETHTPNLPYVQLLNCVKN